MRLILKANWNEERGANCPLPLRWRYRRPAARKNSTGGHRGWLGVSGLRLPPAALAGGAPTTCCGRVALSAVFGRNHFKPPVLGRGDSPVCTSIIRGCFRHGSLAAKAGIRRVRERGRGKSWIRRRRHSQSRETPLPHPSAVKLPRPPLRLPVRATRSAPPPHAPRSDPRLPAVEPREARSPKAHDCASRHVAPRERDSRGARPQPF